MEKEFFGVVEKLIFSGSEENFPEILLQKNREWKFTLERVFLFPSFYSGEAINEKPLECKSLGRKHVLDRKMKSAILWCKNHNWIRTSPEDGEDMWGCTICGVYCHHDAGDTPITFLRYRMCTSCTGSFHECVCGDITTLEGGKMR